ncbi:unnamed protein product, partial [Didymodactylos carnosus]
KGPLTGATMEGKLKEKLESLGLACLCLATGYETPFSHWLAYASLILKLAVRKKLQRDLTFSASITTPVLPINSTKFNTNDRVLLENKRPEDRSNDRERADKVGFTKGQLLSEAIRAYGVDFTPENARRLLLTDNLHEILYPGAHISAGMPHKTYFHHGIVKEVLTPTITVIHFWQDPIGGWSKVCECDLNEFVAATPPGHPKELFRALYLIEYENDTKEKREETLARAQQELDNEVGQHTFERLDYNCEHFAVKWRTGKWDSEQTRKTNQVLEKLDPEVKKQLEWIRTK